MLGDDHLDSADLAQLRRAVADLPFVAPLPEHLVAIGVLTHAVCSIRRRRLRGRLAQVPITRRTQEGIRTDATELLELLLDCRPTGPTAQDPPTSADPYVHRALRFISDRFAQPRLRLSSVAQHVGASGCHIARALKLHTGRTFLSHLHGARVTAAERLLVATTLSVKEIATTIGYNSPTQLCRYFRRSHGISPLVYRRLALRASTGQESTTNINS